MKSADASKPDPILVVSNLEENSLLMHHAAAQARRTGARIILVHVVPPHPAEKKTAPGVVRFADPVLCRAVREELEFSALQLLWQGIVCDPVVLSGDPVEQIAALARARRADRVFAAAREPSLGSSSGAISTAGRLVREADLPVFVFGPQVSSPGTAEGGNGRMLLALSLHDQRPELVRFASGLAREEGSRLALLHVVDISGMTEQQREQAHASARTQLAALSASETDPLFPIEILVREGDVVQSILEEAACPHRDLIVLGAGALDEGAARKGILYRVIENARCPVVAFKGFRDAETETGELALPMTGTAG